MINQQELKQLLTYDPETGVFVWKERPREMFSSDGQWKSWNAKFSGKVAGGEITPQVITYRTIGIHCRTYQAHRLAWLYVYGKWPDEMIDHINGDGTDNRIANLRDVDRSTNGRNARRPKDNKSGVVGVHWKKSMGRWAACISTGGTQKNLGYFPSLFDAAAARKSAELRLGYHPNHGANRDAGQLKHCSDSTLPAGRLPAG